MKLVKCKLRFLYNLKIYDLRRKPRKYRPAKTQYTSALIMPHVRVDRMNHICPTEMLTIARESRTRPVAPPPEFIDKRLYSFWSEKIFQKWVHWKRGYSF